MENNEKRINVVFKDEAVPQSRDTCIISPVEEGLELDFSETENSNNEITIKVFERIIIPKESMKKTLVRFIDALYKYESIYHDGFGIAENKSDNE